MAVENHAEVTALLSAIVRAMVDDPSEVSVSRSTEEHSILITIRVAKSDIGKVIGKQGRTARSLRVILGAIAQTQGEKYSLDIAGQYED